MGCRLVLVVAFGLALCQLTLSANVESTSPKTTDNNRNNSATVRRKRMIGGVRLNTHAHPAVVSILYDHITGNDEDKIFLASGALVRPHIAVTSASRLVYRPTFNISVRLDLKRGDYDRRADIISIHESFHSVHYINDVAVIKVKEPFKLNSNMFLLALPNSFTRLTDNSLEALTDVFDSAVGTKNGINQELFSTGVAQRNISLCANKYQASVNSFEGQKCFVSTEKETHTMMGVGGPLYKDKTLHGVLSSVPICNIDVPYVSTDVEYVLKWLNNTVELLQSSNVKDKHESMKKLNMDEINFYKSLRRYGRAGNANNFLVNIRYKNGTSKCSGAIIDRDIVLTTAECANVKANDIEIYLNRDNGWEVYDVDKIKRHEYFKISYSYLNNKANPNKRLMASASKVSSSNIITSQSIKTDASLGDVLDPNNIAIIKIKTEFVFDNFTQPISYAPKDFKVTPNTFAKVYGYGFKNMSKVFQSLTLTSNFECDWIYGSLGKPLANKICARSRYGIAIEDTGAPLLVGRTLVGLLSAVNFEPNDYRMPLIAVELAPHYDWIYKKHHHDFNKDL